MSPTYLFLPHGDRSFRWARVEDGALLEGEGLPTGAEEVVAVAPADTVALHWAELPTRSQAQATAAARLLAAEASAAPLADLHVAVGDEGLPERPIGVVGLDTMRLWLAELARAGVDPVAIVPAPMLVPAPREGYARADLAGEGVVRGPATAFSGEGDLTGLLIGDAPLEVVDQDELAAALDRSPRPLDLLQGPFAPRRRLAIDWRHLRRLARYAGAILLATLAIDAVKLARYSFGADDIQARADAVARQGLPRGATVTEPSRQLDERLAGLRGPGQGFSATSAAVFAAVQAVPGSELTTLSFEADGDLRLGVTTATEAAVTDLRRAIERAGFRVDAGTFQSIGGRVSGEFVVRPR